MPIVVLLRVQFQILPYTIVAGYHEWKDGIYRLYSHLTLIQLLLHIKSGPTREMQLFITYAKKNYSLHDKNPRNIDTNRQMWLLCRLCASPQLFLERIRAQNVISQN